MNQEEIASVFDFFNRTRDMTREEIMAEYSRLRPEERQLFELLVGQQSEQAQDQPVEVGDEIGFEYKRIHIAGDEYYDEEKTEIIEQDGRLGIISSRSVWDCGHSKEAYPFGGIDSFGHAVCVYCLRWCDYGNHPCCVLDSELLSNGKRRCREHRFLKRLFGLSRLKRDF